MKMKSIALKSSVVLAAALSAAGAFAQSNAVTANVPFAFSIHNKVLPAGRYYVEGITSGQMPEGILVRNIDHPEYAVLELTSSSSVQPLPTHPAIGDRLVFDNRAGQYFLRGMRSQSNAVIVELPMTKSEKNAESQKEVAQRTQTAVIVGQ